MNILTMMGIALGLGWLSLWFLLHRNLSQQSQLEKKINELENKK